VISAWWRNGADAIETSTTRLRRGLRTIAQHAGQRLANITRHEFFRRPLDRINTLRQLLDDRQRAMRSAMKDRIFGLNRELGEMAQTLAEHSPTVRVRLARQHLTGIEERLTYVTRIGNRRRLQQLDALERELNAVSPDAVLRRGYSMTTLKNGAVVRSVKQVTGGEKLVTRLVDGTIESTADDPKQPKLF
jgi:exodeoxyribonuclease VII large subunit